MLSRPCSVLIYEYVDVNVSAYLFICAVYAGGVSAVSQVPSPGFATTAAAAVAAAAESAAVAEAAAALLTHTGTFINTNSI